MGKNYLLFLRISIHYFFFFLQVCQPEPLTVFFSCCGTCNVSLNTAVVQCWKTERWLIWTQAGLVALVFDWLVHIEMMGHQKKTQHIWCPGYCFSWSAWSFHPEISRAKQSLQLPPHQWSGDEICVWKGDEATEQMNKSVSSTEKEWHRIHSFPL